MTDAGSIKSILILDDDMDFRLLLKTILRKYFQNAVFHEYDPVALGAPADDYDWSPYDVLILDYYLCVHRLTGLDLLQKHRKRPGFPAAIMLTGAGTEETAVRAMNFGAYEYLRKDKLDKAVLAASIIDAYQKHALERKKQDDAEKARNIFDKSRFYKQLEHAPPPVPGSPERVFLIIDVDNFSSLETSLGPIKSDNLGRALARLIYEQPAVKQGNPGITRLSKSAIGVLMDVPKSKNGLSAFLEGLCRKLADTPYRTGETAITCTVSAGAVVLGNTYTKEAVFTQAGSARDQARAAGGNSFHIYSDTRSTTKPEPVVVAPKVVEVPVDAVTAPPKSKPAVVAPKKPAATRITGSLQKKIATKKAEKPRSVKDIPLEVDEEDIVHPVQSATTKQARVAEPAKAQKPVVKTVSQPEVALKPDKAAITDKVTEAGDVQVHPPVETAPAVVAEDQKGTSAETDDLVINEADLDENSLNIKKAFDDNRCVQTFQPIIAMSGISAGDALEFLRVDIQLVEQDGKIITAGEFKSRLNSLPLQKFIDRWMLRQLIGRIVRVVRDDEKKRYLLPITEAWFTDITLFGWLKELLSGLEVVKPGQYIVLEISADIFSRYEERVMILIKTLRKTYGFRIALGNISNADAAVKRAKAVKFDFLMLDYDQVQKITGPAPGDDKDVNMLNALKAARAHFIINGVENATILTEAISAGADYVMGNFIGEPQTNVHGASNVESFDIG